MSKREGYEYYCFNDKDRNCFKSYKSARQPQLADYKYNKAYQAFSHINPQSVNSYRLVRSAKLYTQLSVQVLSAYGRTIQVHHVGNR
jgi:hypothetical protein